jgi:uncharacterized phage-associated protein
MTASAHDIAAEIRRRLPGVGVKKLHKLLYYAHGHHLANLGVPLFSESVRAFEMGPVVKQLWQDEDRKEPAPEPHELTEAELNSIGYTISQFGRLSGVQLERLSHTERPWIDGWASAQAGGGDKIPNEAIAAFFRAQRDREDAEEEAETGVPREVVRAWLRSVPPSSGPDIPDDVAALVAKLTNA